MYKKSLFFGAAALALFLAALMLMTGCSQATDSTTTVGRNSIYGNVTAVELQTAVDRAVAAGESLVFESPTIGAGQVNLKTARIVVRGTVTLSAGAFLNGADAAVTQADEDARIVGNTATSYYIYPQGMTHDWVTGTNIIKVEYLPGGLSTMQSTSTHVAVREFKLGPARNNDYSVKPEGVDPNSFTTAPGGLTAIYVIDKLTIPADANVTGAGIDMWALGTADVTGDLDLSGITANDIVFAQCSTLTSSREGGVTIVFEASVPGTKLAASTLNVKVESGKNITVRGGATATTLNKLDGSGTLLFDADPTAVTINGGDGTIEFAQPVTAGTFVLKDTVKAVFGYNVTAATFTPLTNTSTGKVTFKGTVAFAAASTIRGAVEFNKAVTRTAGALGLLGDVTLKNDVGITFASADTLTLGKSVFVGPDKILTAVGTTVLTPTATATLTAAAAPPENADQAAIDAAKKITLGTEDLAITSGTLEVASGGIFAIATGRTIKTTSVAAPTPSGFLQVAPGGAISLDAIDAIISFGPTVGDNTITGAIAMVRAAGAAVTLGKSITGNAGASLAITAADALLTVTGGGKTLTLEKVTLDLTANGKLVIAGAASVNTVTLRNQAKVLLNSDPGVINTKEYIKGNAHTAAISGDAIARGANDTDGAVYAIEHGTGNSVVLTGAGASSDVEISKASTTFSAVAVP
jgi:hypothetical protein